jgi:hypothetical protein
MVFGINQEALEKAKQVGDHFTMEVVKSRQDGKIEFKLIPKDEWAQGQLSEFIDGLTNQLCSQFHIYFNMKGKIVDVD